MNRKTAYLDIETSYTGRLTNPGDLCRDYSNHRITVIGIRTVEDDRDQFVQLVRPEISRERLMRALEGVGRVVTYNGRSVPDPVKGRMGFDFPVIQAQLGVVLDEELPHLDLCPACWRANLWGGQKKVEEQLGFKRSLPARDGAWADKTWKRYEASGDAQLLAELLAYNKEDVFMLRRIEQALEHRGQCAAG